ncbi:hypothetical protein A3A60_02600 [Candidatus Curtissbacteria bacterium RIFCSPLOWO2_01_FULL_42_26]|uniref:Uncharacterized protein n=1 Tax=Candidatus Curtissbacteria bacterium RIFCSPLOWO2_01_FULL_42_26 TaxID=1797729 RepID=A0A1F5I3I9_9BACT|nr:MAG: hypothetical protein A3A60_02600 [Candidatus Curtissbacteria bacterium RIFCSPLOWO2_01_FULL_42_26]
MTLAKFKQRLKIGTIAAFAIFYGVSLYSIGRHSGQVDPLKVKGASTINEDEKLDKPLPYADVQSVKIISSSVKLCSNTTLSYQISYPNNWFTTYNKDDQNCRYFAPFSFVVPEFIEKQFVPVQVDALTLEDWAPTVKFFENPNEYENVISAQTIEFNNHLIKKIETSATGNGSTPRGFKQLVYLIFDNKIPLQIVYRQLDEKEDIDSATASLEEMVKSIQYF